MPYEREGQFLLVEDDSDLAFLMEIIISRNGYRDRVVTTDKVPEALKILKEDSIGLLYLGGLNGGWLEIAKFALNLSFPPERIVLATGVIHLHNIGEKDSLEIQFINKNVPGLNDSIKAFLKSNE
jgi:hypothetical protein